MSLSSASSTCDAAALPVPCSRGEGVLANTERKKTDNPREGANTEVRGSQSKILYYRTSCTIFRLNGGLRLYYRTSCTDFPNDYG